MEIFNFSALVFKILNWNVGIELIWIFADEFKISTVISEIYFSPNLKNNSKLGSSILVWLEFWGIFFIISSIWFLGDTTLFISLLIDVKILKVASLYISVFFTLL